MESLSSRCLYPLLLGSPHQLIFDFFVFFGWHPACYFLKLLCLSIIDFISMCSLKSSDQNYDASCIYQKDLLGIYSQDLIQISNSCNIPCILWIRLDIPYITLLMLSLIFFSLCFCTFHLCFCLASSTKEVILVKNILLRDLLFLSHLFDFILFPYE